MNNDWLYSEDRMKLRGSCLMILLKKYGAQTIPPVHTQAMYECAHDWISQGHKTPSGIIKYFEAYYD